MRINGKCQAQIPFFAPGKGLPKRLLPLVVLSFILLAAFPFSPAFAAQDSLQIHWQAFSLPQEGPGRDNPGHIALAVRLTPPPGIYYYAAKVKEGLPTRVLVKEEGEGAPALSVLVPEPVQKKSSRLAGVSAPGMQDGDTLIYDGPSVFLVKVPVRDSGVRLSLEVSGLLCSAKSCTPFRSKDLIRLDKSSLESLPPAQKETWWPNFAVHTFDSQPLLWEPAQADKTTEPQRFDAVKDNPPAGLFREIPLAPEKGAALPGSAFPDREPARELNGKGDLDALMTVLGTVTPRYDNASLEVGNLGKAVFFGLIAGLLLNLMPCVLPVISLKFSALLAVSAMEDKKAQAKHFRTHNLIFAAGIITWFLILALILGSAGLAWGEMFQSPYLITGLAVLLFLLGLSLFGVFSLPVLDLRFANSRYPRLQAFGSGLLATLLATPCSGPLLGGVLGWALRQPLPVLTLSVASVGVGMALPYGVLAMYPGLVRLLPRPGNWTLRLEQLLGFFLMGTVVYLVALLPREWLVAVLANLFLVAFAAWLWGQIGHLGASALRRITARGLAVALVILGAWWGVSSWKKDFAWEEFDAAVFIETLGREPMLVEFTADWCASCKALEKTTLNAERMKRVRDSYNARMIRVDLTYNDEAGQALLKALGSASIPAIALFPPGEGSLAPLVLRDLVTPGQLEEALARTF